MDRRTPMTAGIAFAVLYAVALVLAPRFPGIDKPGSAIVAHVNEHSGAMRAQALLLAFGSLALVALLGYARERLSGPAGYVFTVGAAALLAQVFIATWFAAGLALHPEQLGSATARTIIDIVTMSAPMLTITNLMMAVPILLAANAGQFPRWLGIVAAVFAVEQLIETITIIGPRQLHLARRPDEHLSRRTAAHPVLLGARRRVVCGAATRQAARHRRRPRREGPGDRTGLGRGIETRRRNR